MLQAWGFEIRETLSGKAWFSLDASVSTSRNTKEEEAQAEIQKKNVMQ